jgi:hypothetical protein
MKRYLIFFRWMNGPIQIHPAHAGSADKAYTFFVNTWGQDPYTTAMNMNVLYKCEDPGDWSKTYLVNLEGRYYTVDSSYRLQEIPADIISGNYIIL